MKLLTKEQQKSYEHAKICYIWKEYFENKYMKERDQNIVKLEIIVIIKENIEVPRKAYVI